MLRGLARVVLLFVCVPAFAAVQGGPIPVPLPLFPPNHWWNTDVSAAPADTNSSSYISFIGTTRPLHPDWGGDVGGGTLYGFPYIIVDGTQPKMTVNFQYASESDGAGVPFYPIPPETITQYGWIEGGPSGNQNVGGDRHMLIVDSTNNLLYELYSVFFDGAMWQAGSGAFFDMNTNNRRPDGWTSADAAGLAILPGLVRYDEVYGPNEITHALRVTVRTSNGYVYPASHNAGSTAGALPMGARLRLKPATDISSFSADVQKIFRAFKKYGLIVADNGTDMYISGSYDNRWNMGTMNTAFGQLTASDFEVVQLGWKPAQSLLLNVPPSMSTLIASDLAASAYDANYNGLTSYRGTVHFSSTDPAASLPADYTFTSGDAGTHTFAGGITMRTAGAQTVTATDTVTAALNSTRNVTVIVGPAVPLGVVATATGSTSIRVSWLASANAVQYEIDRQSAGAPYASLTTTAATSFVDAVSSGASYAYKVRAIDSLARTSSFSAPDAATTIAFTDDPLVANATAIKAVHLTEVRQAVNAMRAAAGLAPASFTDATLTDVPIKAVHIQQLRTALDDARAALGLAALVYTDPALITATTIVKAAHVQQLRDGVK